MVDIPEFITLPSGLVVNLKLVSRIAPTEAPAEPALTVHFSGGDVAVLRSQDAAALRKRIWVKHGVVVQGEGDSLLAGDCDSDGLGLDCCSHHPLTDSMAVLASIQRIELPTPGIEQMQAEASNEGYEFLETLVDEWTSGENRFDAAGEILCGYLDQGLLIAVGGLNRDPFLADATVGRIRRLYVRQAWRNRGIGGALLDALLNVARKNFCSVRLRAENPKAARLYERKGFTPSPSTSATHLLRF